MRAFLPIVVLMLLTANSQAKGVYQQPQEFIQEQFDRVPTTSVFRLKGKIKKQIETVLGHAYKGRRVRYWRQGERTVWVLNEIGKVQPITLGIVIDGSKISKIKILVFRETRGWEVRFPFFTQQFVNLTLNKDKQGLNKVIDSISGATLSVNAVTKMSQVALIINNQIKQ